MGHIFFKFLQYGNKKIYVNFVTDYNHHSDNKIGNVSTGRSRYVLER